MIDNKEVRAALEMALVEIPGLPDEDNRSFENMNFEPNSGITWVRSFLIPLTERISSLSSNNIIIGRGLYQVDINIPTGSGTAEADELADKIKNTFKPGFRFTNSNTNVIISYAERQSGFTDGAWYRVPVTISWYVIK